MPSMGEEGKNGGMPQWGKGVPRREETSTSHQGKGAGRREETKENRRKKGGVSYKGKSAARIEEELNGRAKEEGRGALRKRYPRRGTTIRNRMDNQRDSSIILDLQVQREGVLYRRQLGTRSDPLLEVERIKLVWMQREDRGRSGMVQRGKSAAKQHMVRRTGKYSKRGGSRKEIKRTFKMLREVWLNIGVEKIDMHEGIMIKVLLDSGTTGMFMNRQATIRHGFKLQKLERPIAVRNVDGTNNSGEAITYQVECNVFYKDHVKRIRIDVCNLGKTKVILGMPWLAAHNPEINWETGEVKMTKYLLLCGRKSQKKEKVKRVATEEEEKIVYWMINDKENWGKEEEREEDHRKIEEMVPKKFLK